MAVAIKNMGLWVIYTPNPIPPAAPEKALFCKRTTDNADWYAFNSDPKNFAVNGLVATCQTVVGGLIVQAVTRDRSAIFPAGCTLLEITGVDPADPKPWLAFEQKQYNPDTNTIQPWAAPRLPVITYKADIWRRMTSEEAATLYADLQDADPQMRAIYDAAQYIDHAAPEFAFMQAAITNRVGADRAAVLLAPS